MFAYKLIKNAYFEGFIIFLIIASSLKLFIDTYDELSDCEAKSAFPNVLLDKLVREKIVDQKQTK